MKKVRADDGRTCRDPVSSSKEICNWWRKFLIGLTRISVKAR